MIAPDLSGMQVLVVDANKINHNLADEFLRATGLQVTFAGSSAEARQKLGESRIDVVLLAFDHPGQENVQLVQELRRDPRFRPDKLPIVGVSAALENEYPLNLGLNMLLPAPLDLDGFAGLLQSWRAAGVIRSATILPGLQAQILDTRGALNRLGGDQAVYDRLCVLFQERQAGTAVEIRAALERGDLLQARRLAHTLRGTAGTIGAEVVRDLARRMEAALLEGDRGLLAGWLNELENQLALVMEIFSRPGHFDRDPAAQLTGNRTDVISQLRRLFRLLKENDAEALEQAAMLARQNSAVEWAPELRTIELLTRRFEFGRAFNELQALALKESISLEGS